MILKRGPTSKVLATEFGHEMVLVSCAVYPNDQSYFHHKTCNPQKLQFFAQEVTCCLFRGTQSQRDTL